MSSNLTPLDVAERLIGSKPRLAEICGVGPKAPYTWARAAKWRPAGYFPVSAQLKLIAHVRRAGLPVDPLWLIEGAPIEAVHGALDEMKARAA